MESGRKEIECITVSETGREEDEEKEEEEDEDNEGDSLKGIEVPTFEDSNSEARTSSAEGEDYEITGEKIIVIDLTDDDDTQHPVASHKEAIDDVDPSRTSRASRTPRSPRTRHARIVLLDFYHRNRLAAISHHRSLIATISIQPDCVILYTDGSYLSDRSGGAGWAIYVLDREISCGHRSIPKASCSHETEVVALSFGISHAVTLGIQLSLKHLYVFSDSQSCINNVLLFTAREKEIGSTERRKETWNREVMQELEDQTRRWTVHPSRTLTIGWVPAHDGITGNERADSLAKQGSWLARKRSFHMSNRDDSESQPQPATTPETYSNTQTNQHAVSSSDTSSPGKRSGSRIANSSRDEPQLKRARFR